MLTRVEAYDAAHPDQIGTCREIKQHLHDLCVTENFQRVLEVGVSAGTVTAYLAAAMQATGGEVVSVDNWSQDDGGKADGPGLVEQRLEAVGLRDRVTLHAMSSRDYFARPDVGLFDLVWIDGDHSVQGALADIRDGWAATRYVLAVHDVTYLGRVAKAVQRSGIAGETLEIGHGIWIARKP